MNYINPFPPAPPGPTGLLQCAWKNAKGQCSGEVDFVVSFGPPPCGHSQTADVNQTIRLCGRHMLRSMFTMMTKQHCGQCGSQYQGIAILRTLDRL